MVSYNSNPNQMTGGINFVPYTPTPVALPQTPQQPRYISGYEPMIYVTGIEGANAYQMPPGVSYVILWDTEFDSFYIKKLDEMGRPRVVAWKDFVDHVVPEKQEAAPVKNESNEYLTKADFESMLDKALSELSVGERGRIVRINELNS